MNTRFCRPASLPALLALALLLAGCQHLGVIRLQPDRPADLAALMEEQEYGRAEQLLHQHPELDTPQVRAELNRRIAAFETAVLSDARTREAADDFYGAHVLLLKALNKLPDSRRLNEYRRQLDAERSERLIENERREMLARARYFVAHQDIYDEHLALAPPSLMQRLQNTLIEHEAADLAARLLACGQKALQQDKLDLARECLHYTRAIKDSADAQTAWAQLQSRVTAKHRSEEKKERVTRRKQAKQQAKKHKDRIHQLLERTEEALDQHDLVTAQRYFRRLPSRASESEEVLVLKARLNEAVQSRVKHLQIRAERLYRAEHVQRAIRCWEQALELQPDNQETVKRLARARKVLAHLEELKSRQHAPARQAREGT